MRNDASVSRKRDRATENGFHHCSFLFVYFKGLKDVSKKRKREKYDSPDNVKRPKEQRMGKPGHPHWRENSSRS